jgi:ADP-heptose:LPS heptosyltransferase
LIIRKLCKANYWSEFDRYAPKSASERTLDAFHNAGFEKVKLNFKPLLKSALIDKAKKVLSNYGWKENERIIVLNPAGLWITRNWPVEHYFALAELFLKEHNVKFLMLGDEKIKEKSIYLSSKLGDRLINLTFRTSLGEAFAALSLCSLIISEDSALYHMAWALGIPSVLLLGSTRSDWTYHRSDHIVCLSSDDLPCGNCMQPVCKFGDVHCLTRYQSQIVYEKAIELLTRKQA